MWAELGFNSGPACGLSTERRLSALYMHQSNSEHRGNISESAEVPLPSCLHDLICNTRLRLRRNRSYLI